MEKKDEGEHTIDQELVDARIGCTERMLDNVLELDVNMKQLKILGQKFHDVWHQFDEAVNENTGKFQAEMKASHKEKLHIITYCSKLMREEELKAEAKSIEMIRELQGKKKHTMRELEGKEDVEMLIEDYEPKLIQEVANLEDNLMDIEMMLQDALHASVQTFLEKIKALNGEMKQNTIKYIKFVADEAEKFNVNIKEVALKEQVEFENKVNNTDNGDFDPE